MLPRLALLCLLPLFGSCSPGEQNDDLADGWNTWNTYSVLSHVLLPEGLAINLQVQDGESGDILEDALIGRSAFDSMEHVTPGPRSYDGSYTELTLEWRNVHIQVQSASVDDDLYLLVTPIDTSPGDLLIVDPEIMWSRHGKTVELVVNAGSFASTSTRIEVPLARVVTISTDAEKSVDEIADLVDSARADILQERSKYQGSADLFDAVHAALAWNVIYEPTNDRVITPVSRRWSVSWGGWILFEWDTYFAAYMHSLNNKELAYANVVAITHEITDRGFVPNFASSRNKSEDRSQLPVGSFVVREIYRKYREDWFVEEVFDELLTWNRWWVDNRDIDGYLVWGSDPYEHEELPEWLEEAIGEKQGSKWESGLDNSPMYDDATHDSESHRLLQADVGLMSAYILDCKSLSDLAGALGKNEIQAELIARARVYSDKLETLWNEEFGLYLNKDLVTGEFSYRLSPTLFYPLLAQVPDQHQAKRMIDEHYFNPDEFWGIWAPMNFLVYLGMRNYDLPEARKDLVAKSSKLLLQSWLSEKHVYENYNAETGQGDDAGMSDKFYHWGALLGFIGLIEEGYIASPQLPLNKVD
jgi:hypothetical protein